MVLKRILAQNKNRLETNKPYKSSKNTEIMLEAILFDIDGVLVDSEKLYFTAIRDAFRKFGFELSGEEYCRRYMIEHTNSAGIIKDYGLKVLLKEYMSIRDEMAERLFREKLQPMPHARELVEELEWLYPMGVVSASSPAEIEMKLGIFNPEHPFKVIVSDRHTNNSKPHPDPYLKGLELLRKYANSATGLPAQNVVAIEDTPSGVKSASEAGCKTIAFPNGFTRRMDFSMADRVVYSLDEITPRLLFGLYGKNELLRK